MYQRDYILRMIEMLADLVAAILGFIKKGNLKLAEKALDDAFYTMLRKDAGFFQNIPTQKLTETLIREHNYTNGHLEILAELFFVEAELQSAKRQFSLSLEFYKKSLILLEFIDKEYKIFSQKRLDKIKSLNEKIEELDSQALQ
jgi:hypothetical protein